MLNTYACCYKLTTAICGDKVTDMSFTYQYCWNLTTPACGPNVTNMSYTYHNCSNLTTAICGPNVTSMWGTYYNCTNLTTAVCGPNVTDMRYAYSNCRNLTTAVCGNNVSYIDNTYRNCTNIRGNAYFYSNNISSVCNCFNGRSTSNRLNIYVHAGSTSNTRLRYSNALSIFGASAVTWSTNSTNNCFYNTRRNVYVYYVANVEASRIANGD
jgi:hypothetical protein